MVSLKLDLATDGYVEAIGFLRDKAKHPYLSSHGRPVLPSRKEVGEEELEVIILERGSYKGLLRIRRYDLRLMSYQNAAGHCYHVSNYGLYCDSKLVYDGFIGLSIGLSTLTEAIDYLQGGVFVEKDVKVRISLFVFCVVLCEAAKLDMFKNVFANAFKLGVQVPLTLWMMGIIGYWVDLSKDLLTPEKHQDTKDCNLYLPDAHNLQLDNLRRMIGVNCQDVARCLGILFGSVSFPPPDEPSAEHCARFAASPLAEIYSVLVYFKGRKHGCVYGSIIANEILIGSREILYNRGPDECETIPSNGTISLQNTGFIYGRMYIFVKVDLKEKESNLEISRGELVWYVNEGEGFMDSRLSAIIRGEHGYAVIFYTVYSRGIVATIELSLSNKDDKSTIIASDGDGDGGVCVCGNIGVGSTAFDYKAEHYRKYYMSTLFSAPYDGSKTSCSSNRREDCQGQLVKMGAVFPLSKCVMAVDADCTLLLNVELKTCKGESILNGSKEWMPLKDGSSTGSIVDGSYVLHVKVNWRRGWV